MFCFCRYTRAAGLSILYEFRVRELYFSLRIISLSRNGAVLYFCSLVLVSRLGHQFIGFGSAFDYAWFDSAGAVADFVIGYLQKIVMAQSFANRFLRRHQPLRQQGIARNSKTHLPREFIMNERCLGAN